MSRDKIHRRKIIPAKMILYNIQREKYSCKNVFKENKDYLRLNKGEKMQSGFGRNKKLFGKWVKRAKQGASGKVVGIKD